MAKTMNVKVLNVVKSTAHWASETTIISKGLLCVEMTTDGKTMIKIGDGVKTYSQLPYIVDGSFSISDYYTSEQTDSAISDAISALGNIIHIKGVKASAGELPTEGNTIGDMWFVNVGDPKTSDDYAEYVWTEGNKWEFIGRVASEVDLSDYATTTYANGFVNISKILYESTGTSQDISVSGINTDMYDYFTIFVYTAQYLSSFAISKGAMQRASINGTHYVDISCPAGSNATITLTKYDGTDVTSSNPPVYFKRIIGHKCS